jgi:hypothetical protein
VGGKQAPKGGGGAGPSGVTGGGGKSYGRDGSSKPFQGEAKSSSSFGGGKWSENKPAAGGKSDQTHFGWTC